MDAPETLKVSFEGGDDNTRIQLNEAGKTVWIKGDLVSVFYRSDANQKWLFQGETGERAGTIKRASAPEYTHTTSKIVVAYPYNENYYLNPETCNLQAFLPAEQNYLKDSYGLNGNIMVSASEYKQFTLKSVCGWLKLQLTGNGEKVQSITLRGNNGEQVAGEIYIHTADATSILAAEQGGFGDDTEVGGTMLEDDTVLTEVTLNCGEGVTLGAEATAFYIALPPQTFEKGLTVEIACTDTSTMTQTTTNAIAIERNTIQPMAALAYEGVIPEVFELAYTTNDGEPLDPYTTDGFGANFVENIYDANTGKGTLKFDGKITTIPAQAFVACTNLTHINLPVGITSINAEAFRGCSKLTIMDIPQGVTTIGDKAFYNCGSVTEITIPSSVTSIGTSSFEGCGGKATINCKIISVYSGPNGKFYKAKFTEVKIADNITSIGAYAFYYCPSLTSATIGNGVRGIGSRAFYECSSLKSVTIPDSVTSIGEAAFCYCPSLTSVTIPDSVTSIGDGAFYGCTSLTSVHISDLSAWCKISFVDNSANPLYNGGKLFLNGNELTELTIPSDITEIKNCTFYNCASLTSITIPEGVTSIGSQAFYNCSSLKSVTIPNKVTSIGSQAFYNCTSLTSATIGKRVTSIGYEAFWGCSSLTNVTIPDSVTEIGDSAFRNCSGLTAFYGKFASEDNRCLIVNGILNSFAPAGITEYAIPDSVTEIGDDAFYGCTSLASITIPDSVTSIGNLAFYNCTSLKTVYCKPTTPPIGGDSMFSYNGPYYHVPIGCKIYVPASDDDSIINAYKAKYNWSNYASYILEYDFSAEQ